MAKRINFDHPMLPFEEFGYEQPKPSQQPKGAGDPADKLLYYMSFGSGSSGNSSYVGSRSGGVIVDVGVRADFIEEKLKESGIPMSAVKGVLLTHDHSDHVRYVYSLLRNNRHLKLFCSNRVLQGILRRHSISKRIKEYHVPIFKEIPFRMHDFEITAFDVPHDGTDNMGFSLEFDGRKFVIATDLGEINDRARHYMEQANYLVVESNYDRDMLLSGRYPEYLKARIMAGRGHLDNAVTAAFLSEIWRPELQHVFLCHLSKDNNTPSKALKASREALEARGVKIGHGDNTLSDRAADVQLTILPRFDATRLYVFRPQPENL